ncbi:MAG TPA: radical SAM protein, partial [Smithellaceae bacterium]|nr:radical SAM protein [Smithellaceae bacterium]
MMTTGFSKYIYGPVPSRRLGRSLGVDLIPFKICTYDCIYCQLGKTTEKTMERRCYVPIKDVLSELKIKLAAEERVDHITIAGSGEPTLHSEIGELIARIKDITNIPLVVLTNGSLLYLEEVRDALMSADIIIPSLDAGDEDMFRHVNRPHNCILFENMVNGLIKFAGDFSGLLWLEVFLLSGLTGMPAEARKIARYANIIGAKKIHLNTVYRPPAEDFACPVDDRQIKKLAPLFQGMVEIAGADKNPAIKGISA